MNLNYSLDRIDGHVHLTCNEKHFISSLPITRRNNLSKKGGAYRKSRRLFYRICKTFKLQPKNIRNWYYFGEPQSATEARA